MVTKGFPWTCPFCNRDTTIVPSNSHHDQSWLTIENIHGAMKVDIDMIVCPNPECRQFTLTVALSRAHQYKAGGITSLGDPFKRWRLIPPSAAKVFPDYVPKPIIDDYQEACLIKDLSPKSAATLARRCLQGMIRNYHGIKRKRLLDEINELKGRVDSLTWQAIDAVRSVGNIGAHMEQDINLIVEVEPDEAAQLIHLIEILVRDWYITRHEREERLKSIVAVGEAKEQDRSQHAEKEGAVEVDVGGQNGEG
ncbi:MAG: DUF4145 domain-containing protein [Candidatus Methylomirabilales bacterium]